jgi:hypothetical protein
MKNFPLLAARGRLDRLVQHVEDDVRANCGKQHTRLQISRVMNDDPAPPWPAPGMPQRCACGEELQYTHVIHHLIP